MEQASVKIGPALRLVGWVAVLSGIACSPMSEQVRDASAWTNGGFEVTRSDLPVNWLVYSPATIPTGRYELVFDDVDSTEVPGDAWTRVERRYVLPQPYERLRFQLSVRSPGTLWIDDVRIAPLGGGEPLVRPGTGGTRRGC